MLRKRIEAGIFAAVIFEATAVLLFFLLWAAFSFIAWRPVGFDWWWLRGEVVLALILAVWFACSNEAVS